MDVPLRWTCLCVVWFHMRLLQPGRSLILSALDSSRGPHVNAAKQTSPNYVTGPQRPH